MAGGYVEFEFVGDEENGSLVASGTAAQNLERALKAGSVEEACRLYEQYGEASADALMDALRESSSGTLENAAKMFAEARDFVRAAKLYERASRWKEAAEHYDQGRAFADAARCYERIRDEGRAAAAYEKAGNLDAALKLYHRAGNREAMGAALARAGRLIEAATHYRAAGNAKAESEVLRKVPATAPERVAAARRLAQIFEQFQHGNEGAQLLVDTFKTCPAARTDRATYEHLIGLLERLGRKEHADKVRATMAQQLGGAPAAKAEELPTADVLDETAATAKYDKSFDPVQAMLAAGRSDDEAYQFLKNIPIFSGLSLENMRALYALCEHRAYQAGEVLIEQGAEGPGLYVTVQGELSVQAGGRELNRIGPGSYVGEISLIQRSPTSAKVVARGDVKALFISRSKFAHFLYAHEDAALRIFRLFSFGLAERVRALTQKLEAA